MSNRLKSSKTKSPNPDKLRPEKEERVKVKDLVKDERTFKIAGAFSLLISVFLLIAFISFIFTWQEDQDKISAGTSILFPPKEIETSNLVGYVGAYISHLFFFNGFGVASFLFCSLFFVIGINALFGRKIFSIWRNVRYLVTGVVFWCIVFSFLTKGSAFPWGGAVGDLTSNWLIRILGSVGTAALLFVGALAYIIWWFNPVFKIPSISKTDKTNKGEHPDFGGTGFVGDESAISNQGNLLKNPNGSNFIQSQNLGETGSLTDFKIIEKEISLSPGMKQKGLTGSIGKESNLAIDKNW